MKHEGSPEGASAGPTIVLIADGWTRSVFLDELAQGNLGGIEEHLIAPGGLITDVVSNLPSVSIASHASILTSTYQDEHGLPGHRWLDRRSRVTHDLLSRTGPANANAALSTDVSTIFESNGPAASTSIQGVIRRGASKHINLPTLRSGPLLRATGDVALKNPAGTIVTWLPRVDGLAHVHGPDSPRVAADMRATSHALGSMVSRLAKAGLADQSRIALIPDHGHRKVTRSANLEEIMRSAGVEVDFNPRSYRSGRSLALSSGDSAAYIYVDPTTRQRRLPEIAAKVATHQAIELACWRDSAASHFVSSEGISVARHQPRDTLAEYEVISGSDPLGLLSGAVTRELLDLSTPMVDRGFYPDIVHQFSRSQVADRSGDLLVMASRTYHFGHGPRVGWRFGFHRGSHGGPFEEELLVAVAYRGVEYSNAPARSAELLARLGFKGESARVAHGVRVGGLAVRTGTGDRSLA